MRASFAKELTRLAIDRSDIVLLSGDIGNRMFDEYKEVAPGRFFNCGIAEANMMSLAAGMALNNLRPFVYTITPFTTTRCLEQIKIGVAYHKAPVTIIGTGSGLSYAELGPTHHSLEDLAIIRCIPDINVLCPSDSNELIAQLNESLTSSKPTYIRIGKKGEPIIYENQEDLGIGKFNLIKEGLDILILASGVILSEALEASTILNEHSVSAAVAGVGSIKPLDDDFLFRMTKKYSTWISIEEHGIIGGLGSSLLEWLSTNNINNVKLERFGTPDSFIHELGNQAYTRKRLGLDKGSIAKRIQAIVK